MAEKPSVIQIWIAAARPRTLPLALSVVAAGNAAAALADPCSFSWPVCIFSLLTTALLQLLSNFANDLGDAEKGTDNASRIGPERAVQSGRISADQMRKIVICFAGLSLFSGLILLYLSYARIGTILLGVFLGAGLLSIAAAITYTMGKSAYGYKALGDPAVFVFFGLIGVCGSGFLQHPEITPLMGFLAVLFGALSTAVLNLNNMRDRAEDLKHGKITIAGKLGPQRAVFYHYALILLAFLSLSSAVYAAGPEWISLMFLVPAGMYILHGFIVSRIRVPKDYDQLLPQLAMIALLSSLMWVLLASWRAIHTLCPGPVSL
jgi:1,4-dihydroxy-2-naphthoate octaprenyltransferase